MQALQITERTYHCLCVVQCVGFHHRNRTAVSPQSSSPASKQPAVPSTLFVPYIVHASMARISETMVKCQKAMGEAAMLCGR